MKTNMYRIFALVLVMALALSLVACGGKAPQDTTPGDTTGSNETTTDTTPAGDVKELTYLSLSYGTTADDVVYLNAYVLDETNAFVEYRDEDLRKEGNVELSVLETLSAAFAASGLEAQNGQGTIVEGDATASMYVEFADGTCADASFVGTIPDEFVTGFEAMNNSFQDVIADMPEFVPQASVMGEVDADRLAAIQEILNSSGIQGLDGLAISEVPMDENFCFSMGMTSTDGIAGGSLCSAMMMTTAYSFAVVTVEDESNIDSVRADFENGMDFGKWVCVRPTDAVIAQKGNMVLCVMGSNDLYTGTLAGIEAAGWENLVTFQDDAQ